MAGAGPNWRTASKTKFVCGPVADFSCCWKALWMAAKFCDILFPQKHYADGQSDFGVNDALLVQSGGGILRELRVVVRFAEKRRGPFKEFQELRKAAQVVAGVEFIVFQKYRIFFRQGFNAVWEEHAFEVQV